MLTDIQEIKGLIKDQSILLQNGMSGFPGTRICLDSDQIEINGNSTTMFFEVWLDIKEVLKQRNTSKTYIVNYDDTYIIVDMFYQAVGIYNYLLKTYEIKD